MRSCVFRSREECVVGNNRSLAKMIIRRRVVRPLEECVAGLQRISLAKMTMCSSVDRWLEVFWETALMSGKGIRSIGQLSHLY